MKLKSRRNLSLFMRVFLSRFATKKYRDLSTVEAAWRALGMFAARLPRLYAISPGSREAVELAERLTSIEAELNKVERPRDIERAYVRLQDVTESHAAAQQKQVDAFIQGMADSIRSLVDRISTGSEEQELMLDELNSIEVDLRNANSAKSLEEVKSYINSSIGKVTRVVQQQVQLQDHMRLEAERTSAMLHKRLAEVESEGRVDSLTRVGNRVAFEYYGQAIQSKVNAGEGPYTLVMIDLDGFKAINDNHGHAAGDEALRTFVDRLRSSIGSKAFIGRLGGDEFAAIVPFSESTAVVRLSRLLRGMERCPIWINVMDKSIEIEFSFSFGCIELSNDATLAQATQRADEIMYEHKRQRKTGRKAA